MSAVTTEWRIILEAAEAAAAEERQAGFEAMLAGVVGAAEERHQEELNAMLENLRQAGKLQPLPRSESKWERALVGITTTAVGLATAFATAVIAWPHIVPAADSVYQKWLSWNPEPKLSIGLPDLIRVGKGLIEVIVSLPSEIIGMVEAAPKPSVAAVIGVTAILLAAVILFHLTSPDR